MKQEIRRVIKRFTVEVLLRTPQLRKRLVYFADFIVRVSRMDMSNDMKSNGELLVQEIVLKHAPTTEKTVVFDVGANVGEWTKNLLEKSRVFGRNYPVVYAFEPCRATYKMLQENMKSCGMENKVLVVDKALSNSTGIAVLNVVGDGIGSNSLYNGIHFERTEEISKIRLDEYCNQNGLDHITLLKIDAEGHDLAVIEGASAMLETGVIDLIQFEYNHRWISARRYLKDVFEFLVPFGYRIGKITPRAIEFYDSWHPQLETFQEGNYLASRKEWIDLFPKISWWRET
jgi:FkbM family methyltransferase